MALLTGTRFGAYEILSLIGAGGMGEVYRARDLQLGRDVAIKVLGNLSTNPDRLRRFEQEARAAAALNHPNILAVYQLGLHDAVPYLVEELLEGETLRRQIKRGRLSVRKVVDYGVQIARGLAAAHEKGIVHRDLKPENLFVTQDGRVKILDFGLAKLTQPLPTSECGPSTLADHTEPGVVLGTVGYMSPEQVRAESTNYRTDIFSFGAVLYEMLTGMKPFRGNTPAETMTAILKEDPPNMLDVVPNLPPGLERIVQRCLEKSPELRFHSASDLAFALEPLSDMSTSERHTKAMEPRPVRLPWAILAGVLLFGAGAGLVWRWHAAEHEAMRAILANSPETAVKNVARPAPPHEIAIPDPETYKWFDPSTGQPLVWCAALPNSKFRFFDAPGTDPQTGIELKSVTPDLLKQIKGTPAPHSDSDVTQTSAIPPMRQKDVARRPAASVTAKLAPEEAAALAREAQEASDDQDYGKAIENCRQVLSAYPANSDCMATEQHASIKMAELLVDRGTMRFERGDFDGAMREAERALALDPANQKAAQLRKLVVQMKPRVQP